METFNANYRYTGLGHTRYPGNTKRRGGWVPRQVRRGKVVRQAFNNGFSHFPHGSGGMDIGTARQLGRDHDPRHRRTYPRATAKILSALPIFASRETWIFTFVCRPTLQPGVGGDGKRAPKPSNVAAHLCIALTRLWLNFFSCRRRSLWLGPHSLERGTQPLSVRGRTSQGPELTGVEAGWGPRRSTKNFATERRYDGACNFPSLYHLLHGLGVSRGFCRGSAFLVAVSLTTLTSGHEGSRSRMTAVV